MVHISKKKTGREGGGRVHEKGILIQMWLWKKESSKTEKGQVMEAQTDGAKL